MMNNHVDITQFVCYDIQTISIGILTVRLCICGGRNYFNRTRVYEALDHAYKHKPFILISGGATGADTLGIQWAKEHDVPYEVYPAQWRLYGKRAGPIRNLQMIASGINLLFAFPGGRGTQHMIAACKKYGIKIMRIHDASIHGVHDENLYIG